MITEKGVKFHTHQETDDSIGKGQAFHSVTLRHALTLTAL